MLFGGKLDEARKLISSSLQQPGSRLLAAPCTYVSTDSGLKVRLHFQFGSWQEPYITTYQVRETIDRAEVEVVASAHVDTSHAPLCVTRKFGAGRLVRRTNGIDINI